MDIKYDDYWERINKLQKQLEDITQYSCNLEDKICYLNADIKNLQQENERLNKGYCKLKEKCNKGECDCYKEEYMTMAEQNTKLSLEKEDYKSRCEKAIKYNYELQERYCHSAIRDELIASKIYEITERELNILQNGSEKDD